MVLLIVALVAGLGIKYAADYQLGLARAEARWHGAQARAYLYNGEGAAIKFLATDDPVVDYLGENWSMINEQPPLDLPDGSGSWAVRIADASAKLNLNGLASQDPEFPNKASNLAARYTPRQRMFIRLLQVLPNEEDPLAPLVKSPEEAAAILEAVVDWVDNDKTPSGTGGGEDDYYLGLPDPYQAANQPFRSIEELQMVRGVTPAIMKALRPYISVDQPVENMNINTLPPLMYRAINLSTEIQPASEEVVKSMLQEVPASGRYNTIEEFKASWDKVSAGTGASLDMEMLTVKTNFFWLTTTVQIGDQRRSGRSLLQRGNPQFKVVRREDVFDGNNP